MIKAALLDLDDTLIQSDTDNFFNSYLKLLTVHLADYIPPEKVVPLLMGSFEQTLHEFDPTRPLYDRLMDRFSAAVNHELPVLEPLFDEFYNGAYTTLSDRIEHKPSAPRLLDTLFNRGYTVVVATNPGLPEVAIHHRMRWGGIAPEDYDFDLITTLETMHFGKPDADYYAEIVLRLGIEPHEAIMVGNDWHADLVGADKAGLYTYWITNGEASPPNGGMQVTGTGSLSAFVAQVEAGWLKSLPCKKPSRSTRMHQLAAYPGALDALSHPYSAAVLECMPGEGEWSARDIACHLRDHETQVRDHLDRVLAEDNPFLSANNSPWEYTQDYDKVSFDEAFGAFVERRGEMLNWLRTLPEDAWKERARDAIFGPTCFEEIVGFLTDHDRTHYQQMQNALEVGVQACGE